MIVGFIGLGTMGSNAARNLRRAGFEMVAYDIRPDAVERQLAPGVQAGRSPADVLNRCDVVVSMVFGPREVEQVLRGPEGFLSADCRGKYWIDMTTSSPGLMRALASEFAARGGHTVDAPVTGSVEAGEGHSAAAAREAGAHHRSDRLVRLVERVAAGESA